MKKILVTEVRAFSMENYQSCFQVQKFCLKFYVHISHFTENITQQLAKKFASYRNIMVSIKVR